MAAPSIFISYRNDDSLPQAGRLYDALEKEFGAGEVFYDKGNLKPGMKWPDELARKETAARAVLVLVADKTKWLGVDDEGNRRMEQKGDWVRKEVEAALSDSQKLVIPVLFNDASLPSAETLSPRWLPDSQLHKLRDCQHKQIRDAHWSDDLPALVKTLREHLGIAEKSKQGGKHSDDQKANFDFHAFTCNRDEQFEQFDQLRATFLPGSRHFFYLYGNEMQALRSFFYRVKNDLDSEHQQAAKTKKPEGDAKRVVALEISVESEGSRDAERLRERFIRDLCSAFGLNPSDYHRLTDQNLQHLLLASKKTSHLRAGGFVCVFAHISHWYWNSKLTPDAVRWFMEGFCPPALPPDSPAVLFFFALDFNEEQNLGVREEVLKTIEQEAQRVLALPELDMVLKKHVAQWLVRHERHISPPLRQQLLAQMFNAPEYCMADLEPHLKKLIDDYFNAQST